tara:strand:- start:996 stop:1172 length:177 start_codon:yes stop_codon:yes gene_type:complete
MSDLELQNNNLRKIVEAKDRQILDLQLQLLQLTTANSEVNNEQTKSNEVSASNSKSGK